MCSFVKVPLPRWMTRIGSHQRQQVPLWQNLTAAFSLLLNLKQTNSHQHSLHYSSSAERKPHSSQEALQGSLAESETQTDGEGPSCTAISPDSIGESNEEFFGNRERNQSSSSVSGLEPDDSSQTEGGAARREFLGGAAAQAIWAEAWEALEPPSKIDETSKGRRPKGKKEAAPVSTAKHGRPLRKPMLALQGLTSSARAQLLAVSLLSLEEQVQGLPAQFVSCGTEAEWKLLLPALLASCSLNASRAWLGYVPPAMQAEATQLTLALQAGSKEHEVALALSPAMLEKLQYQNVQLAEASSSPGKLPEASEAVRGAHLWDAAAEKATIHALILKHILTDGESELASSDESFSSDDSSGERQAVHERQKSQHEASTSEQTGFWGWLSNTLAFGTTLPAWRHETNRANFKASAAERKNREGYRQKENATGNKHRSPQVRSSRSREAAKKLLQSQATGVRGWGVESSSVTPNRPSPVIKNAPWILQDMAVTIADAAAAAYLAEAAQGLSGGPARVSSEALESANWPTFLHPKLFSTRALERFRNQIAFHRLWTNTWEGVVAIHEDRHTLLGIGNDAALCTRPVSVRRAKELKALTGWRANASLALEALDFLAPLLQRLARKGSEALAWLLVTLIGRSLGLIFRGIRQSLKPRPRPKTRTPDPNFGFA